MPRRRKTHRLLVCPSNRIQPETPWENALAFERAARLAEDLRKPLVHILLGTRQTGKTTLAEALVPRPALWYDLADPGTFCRECEALPGAREPSVIVVDEAPTVPARFDAVQVTYDRHPHRWRFVLCSSSARRLRKSAANLLPGPSLLHRLFPLILPERLPEREPTASLVLPVGLVESGPPFPMASLARITPLRQREA